MAHDCENPSWLADSASEVNVDPRILEGIVSRVVKAVPTERVCVFGSYARGEEREGSDLDIFVVGSDETMRNMRGTGLLRKTLFPFLSNAGLDFDVLMTSHDTYQARKDSKYHLEHQVEKEGVIIYER